MQICDNKSHLGKVFELGKEAVGYSSIEEAIDLTHYYLEHDAERKFIAAAGWKRSITDYNEVACFKRVVDAINELNPSTKESNRSLNVSEVIGSRVGFLRRILNRFVLTIWGVYKSIRFSARLVMRAIGNCI
jgi:hypothetical protein